MAVVWNIIVIFVLIYYTFYIFSLLFSKNRNEIKNKNNELNTLRKIPIKTLEEQKSFLDIKYTKPKKFKFTWKWLGKVLLTILITIILYRLYTKLFNILNITFKLWHVVIIIIVLPLLLNLILKIFKLEKDDITIFFK